MSEFMTVAKLGDIPSSGKLCLEVEDRFVVIVRIEDQFFCLDDVCTHDGGPLGEGELTGFCLACPRHGAQFDVRTGAAVTMPATEPTVIHEIRVVGDELQVRLAE
jgi:3-phenylpropionate/trans-cinnamate dioxygenase ferredoxin subunit